MDDFLQVHSEAEPYDRGLQEKLRKLLAFNVIRVGQGEAVNQASE